MPDPTASTGAPEEKAADRPSHYYVVSDCHGFVGAFLSAGDAEKVMNEYTLVPFIVQRFEIAPGPIDTVWVVLYRDIDAVLFVSNSLGDAERVRDMYSKVGLTYTDPLHYWEQPAGAVAKPAQERLKSLSRAHAMYAMPAESISQEESAMDRVKNLSQIMVESPIARLLRECEPITIMDCVVPTPEAVSAANVAVADVAADATDEAAEEAANAADETPIATRAEAPVAADQ